VPLSDLQLQLHRSLKLGTTENLDRPLNLGTAENVELLFHCSPGEL
jgi:hypothetical protein